MSLAPGARLGPYEVLAPLGAGGMGEVFRARDTRLGREVAVKVLPDHFAHDMKALARFESEAKAVGALSHPNILALHDVGEVDGVRYAVTELLEGETLRAVVWHGALPVRRALEIASHVASALAAAHEKGILHRDVKPENVFLTRDGHVKLLDFGLARPGPDLGSGHDTRSPTAPVLTEAGEVVGTVAYMSPEQARGERVDFRSDQFSLGVVLYEMLSGTRPFKGASAADLLAAIVRDDPERSDPAGSPLPAPVRWVVERCLSKDPAERFAATHDLARELASLRSHLEEAGAASGGAPATRAPARRWAVAAAAVSLAAAAVLGALLARERARGASDGNRLEVRLPEGYYLSLRQRAFDVAHDGRLLVLSAWTWKTPFLLPDEARLYVRPLDSLDVRAVEGTEGAGQPVLSPDGRHLAFVVWSGGKPTLGRVPLAGGPTLTLCACDARMGAAWTDDGFLLFAGPKGPLWKVPETGGTPEPATSLDTSSGEISHRLPHLLPDGRTVLYTALRWGDRGKATWERARIYSQRPGEKERSLLVEGGSDGRWAEPGLLVFAQEGRLLAAPLDGTGRRLEAQPVPVVANVSHSIYTGNTVWETGAAQVAVAGRLLAWVPGSVAPESEHPFVLVDAAGRRTPLPLPKGLASARFSPDGRGILASPMYPGRQLEVLEVSRGARRGVTFGEEPRFAIWGPGPGRITYASSHEGPMRIYCRKVDVGEDEIETLFSGEAFTEVAPTSWSADGKTLAFVTDDGRNANDVWLLERGGTARRLLGSPHAEQYPEISPDGRWLLYTSDAPGRNEVLLRPLSGEGPPRQVSVEGGMSPRWSRDGSEVLYWKGVSGAVIALYRVRVRAGRDGLDPGQPEKVLEGEFVFSSPTRSWDLAPDGRVLVGELLGEAASRERIRKVLSDRIVVDEGGVARLLAEASARR